MPRNLTDLMELATASAPPEPHNAADITRLAAHRQRRRTTGLAGGVALAVVVAGVAGYGATRGHATTPQPAARYKYDQTVDVSQVVPASTLPGYTLEPWTVPSLQHLGSGQTLPTYQAVDSAGRLLVVRALGDNTVQGPFRAQLYDAPGDPAQPLPAPTSPGSRPVSWLPGFYDADHLLWHSPQPTFHITDLRGGHDQVVPATFRVGSTHLVALPEDVTAGSMWMTGDSQTSQSGVTVSDLYRATFSGEVTKVGTGVTSLDVGSGVAGWLTTQGRVFVQSATGTQPQRVPVPLDPGCRVTPASFGAGPAPFVVSSSAVALTELCGTGAKATDQVLAFDLSGRPLVRITGVQAFNMSFAGSTLLFQGNELLLRYDLRTGILSQLNTPQPPRAHTHGIAPVVTPSGAGSYVLWYDGSRGKVARIP